MITIDGIECQTNQITIISSVTDNLMVWIDSEDRRVDKRMNLYEIIRMWVAKVSINGALE